MINYSIYWQPQLQPNFSTLCPFVNVENGEYVGPSAEWPNGYFVMEQDLNQNQFEQVDQAAVAHVCIDVKPSPRPPYNPHGR